MNVVEISWNIIAFHIVWDNLSVWVFPGFLMKFKILKQVESSDMEKVYSQQGMINLHNE